MTAFARIAAPAVWLLDTSTRLIFRAFGQSTERDSRVSDEEIKALIAEAESAGVIESHERQMISGVMRFADRAVGSVMTPRTDVDWIDINAPEEAIRERLTTTPHSRLPVGEGSADMIIGVVQTRELLAAILASGILDVRAHVRKAPIVPETTDALDALTTLREAEVPMALIHDEYWVFEGLVTPADVLEAIAGAFRSDADSAELDAVEREDGSWLLAGAMPVDEMADRIGLALPEQPSFHTVAGLVLAHAQHLPEVGECIEAHGWRFEVLDLDGRRIDKVLATRSKSVRRPK